MNCRIHDEDFKSEVCINAESPKKAEEIFRREHELKKGGKYTVWAVIHAAGVKKQVYSFVT